VNAFPSYADASFREEERLTLGRERTLLLSSSPCLLLPLPLFFLGMDHNRASSW
jgi:hypothetical protein